MRTFLAIVDWTSIFAIIYILHKWIPEHPYAPGLMLVGSQFINLMQAIAHERES